MFLDGDPTLCDTVKLRGKLIGSLRQVSRIRLSLRGSVRQLITEEEMTYDAGKNRESPPSRDPKPIVSGLPLSSDLNC